jgi:hypothetical protein
VTEKNPYIDDPDFPPKRRPNAYARLPYGYQPTEEDPCVLEPKPEMAPFIKEALDYIDSGGALRETAAWLTEKTGVKISHQGINKIWKERRGSDPQNEREKKQKKQRQKQKPKTGPEKKKAQIKRKAADAKRILSMQEKKLQNWVEPEEYKKGKRAPDPYPTNSISDTLDHEAEPAEQRVVFKPNPGPQTEFLAAPEYALLADPMRYFDHPSFAGIIFRRTNDELRELIWKSQELYPQAFPGAKWQERKSQWVFPNGGRLWLTYLERDEDVLRYQGQSFSYIAFDEITQYPTPFPWDYMRSRLRTTAPDLPVYQRATSNPGGPGHCLTHGEVLTPDRGWVDITKMQEGDLIYSVDEGGSLFETVVDHTYKEWVEEDIVRVKARGLRMSITKDHKVAKVGGTRGDPNKAYSLVPFSDLPGQATILRSANFNGQDVEFVEIEHSGGRKRRTNQPHCISVEDYAALVGWYVSEGYRVHRDKAVSIAQSKPEGRKSIAALLNRIGFHYCVTDSCFNIYCSSLYEHMGRYGDGSTQKQLTQWFKNLPTFALKSFFQAAMEGDGCGSYYYTISEKLKDDFSEVAFKIGRLVYVSERQRENRNHTTYQISTKHVKSGGTEILTGNYVYNVRTKTKRSSDISYVPYKGYVYCVGVPETHSFIARQDGSVWVSGNTWVKKMFVDPAPAGQSFTATNIETGEPMVYPDNHEKAGQPLFQRRFIPASLYDNPYLTQDTSYEASLLSLPEMQRRQLLEGDWTIAEGAAFSEFRTATHVCEPFEIPENWRRFRSCDYGYSSYSAVHWFAIDPAYETLFVYRELYVSKHTGKDLAKAVLEAEKGERIDYGVLDSSAWHQRGQVGPSIAEEMISMGCRWRPSDRSNGARVSGKNRLHELLKVDETTGMPGIVFFNTCRQIIADLPVIPADPKGSDDIDPKYQSDHAYDSIRYGVMSRPRAFSPFSDGTGVPTKRWRPAVPQFGY